MIEAGKRVVELFNWERGDDPREFAKDVFEAMTLARERGSQRQVGP